MAMICMVVPVCDAFASKANLHISARRQAIALFGIRSALSWAPPLHSLTSGGGNRIDSGGGIRRGSLMIRRSASRPHSPDQEATTESPSATSVCSKPDLVVSLQSLASGRAFDEAGAEVQEGAFAAIAGRLGEKGIVVIPDFLAPAHLAALRNEARQRHREGFFRPAGIGKGAMHQILPAVRGDFISWLDDNDRGAVTQEGDEAISALLRRLEMLRVQANRAMFLGVYEMEGHFAVYGQSTGYSRHVDQARGTERRQLTFSLYLNDADWLASDGGSLRIYIPPVRHEVAGAAGVGGGYGGQGEEGYVDVIPRGGTCVIFLSAEFEHEVLACQAQQRLSFTGWLLRRG
jgi:SM-20-related protein